MFVDDKWIFVGPMAAAAILDHSKAARIDLVGHALIEHDHAVRDIFLEPVTSQRVLAALAGDDRGDTEGLQTGESCSARFYTTFGCTLGDKIRVRFNRLARPDELSAATSQLSKQKGLWYPEGP